MVNVTKSDIEKLERPDYELQKTILPTEIKAAKAFRCLELGITPVRFVIMEKRLMFLKYILDEGTETMIYKVYEEQRKTSKKGDFVDLVKSDLNEMEIKFEDKDIQEMSKQQWKKLINQKIKEKALNYLVAENDKKEKTRHIKFNKLEMSNYLNENKSTSLSKLIFSIRSGTLDIKCLNKWNYGDNLCVMCELKAETLEHLMICPEYGEKEENGWREIYGNNPKKQINIAKMIKKRMEIRKIKQEAGQDSPHGSHSPTYCC